MILASSKLSLLVSHPPPPTPTSKCEIPQDGPTPFLPAGIFSLFMVLDPPVLRSAEHQACLKAVFKPDPPTLQPGPSLTIPSQGTVPDSSICLQQKPGSCFCSLKVTAPLPCIPRSINPQSSFCHKPYSNFTHFSPFFNAVTLVWDTILPVRLQQPSHSSPFSPDPTSHFYKAAMEYE